MLTQVKSWGNSQGIRLSKEILESTGIQLDEVLELEASQGQIIIKKQFRHKPLKERMDDYGGNLNLVSEGDWDKPLGGEVW